MKPKKNPAGKSLVFNILFVVLNLSGLALVEMGLLPFFENYFLLFSFSGYLLLALSSAGLFIFHGRLIMSYVARVVAGAVFLIAGILIVNDPIGFSFRLKDLFLLNGYSGESHFLGLSSAFLSFHVMTIEVVLIVLLLLTGVYFIIGNRLKWFAWIALIIAGLAVYSGVQITSCANQLAQQNVERVRVSAIGKTVENNFVPTSENQRNTGNCVNQYTYYGDPLKIETGKALTPIEQLLVFSALLYFVLWVLIAQWVTVSNDLRQNIWFIFLSLLLVSGVAVLLNWYWMILIAFILLIFVLWLKRAGGKFLGHDMGVILILSCFLGCFTDYTTDFGPLKDFSPFAKGKNLKWELNDGRKTVLSTTYILKNKKTGELESYALEEYKANPNLWNTSVYRLEQKVDSIIRPGIEPTIGYHFNPHHAVESLTDYEKKSPLIRFELTKKEVKGITLFDASNKITETIALRNYSPEKFPVSRYSVVGQTTLDDPEFKMIYLRKPIIYASRIVLLVVPDIKTVNDKQLKKIKDITNGCIVRHVQFLLLTASDPVQVDAFRNKYKLEIPVMYNDADMLYTISRISPALLVLKNGIVMAKFAGLKLPDFNQLKKKTL